MPAPVAPPPDLAGEIAAAALTPASASAPDGRSATAVPIPDLIAADIYLAAKAAVAGPNVNGGRRSGWNSLRPARVIPPGAV